MLQHGIKGWLLKNLQEVVKFGHYYKPIITGNIHKQREKELLNYLLYVQS